MRSLLDSAKALYQSGSAILPEKWSKITSPYNLEVANKIVRTRLNGRFNEAKGVFNFIMVVPVVNWESVLIEEAAGHGRVSHLTLDTKDRFFENISEWHEFRRLNFIRIQEFFEKNYVESDKNVLFLYLSDFYIDPRELKNFKVKNTIIVNFSWDDRLHFESSHSGQSVGVRGIAKVSDINLTMAVAPLSRYMSDGSPVFYWYGRDADPIFLSEIPDVEFEKVMFFGSSYGYRTELVNYLIKRGIPMDVFGKGWGGDFISYEDLAYRIPRYALCLGVSSIGYTRNLTCVKGRDFEVPAAGGLYLTNYSDEIKHVYQSGREIFTYKTMDSCYKTASKILENPSSYLDVRVAGQLRANQFSWSSRFGYLKDMLGQFFDENN